MRRVVVGIAKAAMFSLLSNPIRLRRRLEELAAENVSVILNLHRVAPDDRSAYQPLSPELFSELLEYASRHFRVCRICELDEEGAGSARPDLVLSFDDGYKDFIEIAAPILARFKISANQNIIPKCVETGLPPLNVMAQDFVGRAPRELVEGLDIPGFAKAGAGDLGWRLSRFLKFRSQAEQSALAEHLIPQFQRLEGFRPTAMMSLDEIRQIQGEHELGAHSYEHSSMEFETDEFLRADVRRCRAYFRDKLSAEATIYAFPNGSCRPGQEAIVLSEGVEKVLLVGETFGGLGAVLSRFTFDARSRGEVRYKATGRRELIRQGAV